MTRSPAISFGRVVLPLAIGQTLIWAAIYYSFPALLLFWEADTGWSKPALTGAYTGSLLVAAIASPMVGRLIDAGSGARTMIGGTVFAVILLLAMSQITSLWQFYVVWFAIGVAMAASLYEPCFALLVRHLGKASKQAITRITLVAGFAGTVSFPLANLFASSQGWRVALLVFAILVACITLPLTVMALRQLTQLPVAPDESGANGRDSRSDRRAFWLLAIAFAITFVNHGALMNHLLPLLAERGVAAALAVTAASFMGPMQVLGRVVMIATERNVSTRATTIACFVSMTVAIPILFSAGANMTLVFAFIAIQGAPWGVMSIVRPAIVRDVLGGAGFGLNSGRISAMCLAGSALAPFGGALLWQWGGYDTMLGVTFIMMLIACAFIVLATRSASAGASQ